MAVGVDAEAVGARGDDDIVVDVAGTVGVVASLEAEVKGHTDAVVVVLEELAAVYDELVWILLFWKGYSILPVPTAGFHL